MHDRDKNRDQARARRRAKNDAATALRKLGGWASALGLHGAAQAIDTMRDELGAIVSTLETEQDKRDAQTD